MLEELAKLNQDVLANANRLGVPQEQGYTPTDTQGNCTSLNYTLLLLSHCAPPRILPKGMQAITTLLEHEAATQSAKLIALSVMKRISPS